jgi:acetoin utilization deacetylase AcuC-like enzyme
MARIPVYFHEDQLAHKPLYEWSFGEKINHPETTRRAESILEEIQSFPELFEIHPPLKLPMKKLRELHDLKMIKLFRSAQTLPPDFTYYPSVFPHREKAKADPTRVQHAGFFCYDSGTPITATTWNAAYNSAACAYSAAVKILKSQEKLSYALCRPPGHHASRSLFGGYCYFNNAGIAAKALLKQGKVAILDIDFHHGNGTQSLFYRNPDVLFISIHGDPDAYYPFFTGYAHETGAGAGVGKNLNIPLQSGIGYEEYKKALKTACDAIIEHGTEFLVVSAGFDTFTGDPVGGFQLQTEDYTLLGQALSQLNVPVCVVQEGGYLAEPLGKNVVAFLKGLF